MCRAGRATAGPPALRMPSASPALVWLNTALAGTIRWPALTAGGRRHDAVYVGKFTGGGHPFRGGGVRLHLLWRGRPGDHTGTPVAGGEGADSHLEDGAPTLGIDRGDLAKCTRYVSNPQEEGSPP
jgi:hypothetical protein